MMNNNSTKRVLLTGAGGFIGRHCLGILLSKGFEVHAADVSVPQETLRGLHWHKIDLLDMKQTHELLATVCPTHLLHFAWYAKPGDYWNSLENIRWVEGSLNLLSAFHTNGGKRAVMAGTCAEYDWSYGYCSEHLTPLAPSTLYGTCKNALQHLLKDFSRVTGLSSAWGRIFFLYGPYENPERLVASFIRSLLINQEAYCSHGELIRDFLHVQDVASAFVTLLESNLTGTVNIASGKPTALKDIVNMIADKLNKKELVRFGKGSTPPSNESRLLVAEVNRLHCEMGWEPGYDLDRGLDQAIDWWKRNMSLNSMVK
jgi:nucleoside-diphosphate-sugar epimerase